MASEVKVGDKFIIEVGEVEWHPTKGHRYWIRGFNTCVFDDNGLNRLEKYKDPKTVAHTCANCFYMDRGQEEMPCLMCDKNHFEPRDMFVEK